MSKNENVLVSWFLVPNHLIQKINQIYTMSENIVSFVQNLFIRLKNISLYMSHILMMLIRLN